MGKMNLRRSKRRVGDDDGKETEASLVRVFKAFEESKKLRAEAGAEEAKLRGDERLDRQAHIDLSKEMSFRRMSESEISQLLEGIEAEYVNTDPDKGTTRAQAKVHKFVEVMVGPPGFEEMMLETMHKLDD